MTTADRIDFRPWTAGTPHAVVDDEAYTGRHRRTGARAFSLLRMFYKPRHRAR